MRSATDGSPLVVPNLNQVPARVEEVKRLSRPLGTGLVAWPAHVTYPVKRVAVFDSAIHDALEDLVEFFARHRKRKMLAALGAPRCDLNLEFGRDANHRKRLALPFMLETENSDVELNCLRAIVHHQDQMVEFNSHYGRPIVSSK